MSFPKYDKYKDSDVKWLGDVPEHWGIKRLGYLGRVQNGLNIGGEAFGAGDSFVSYGDVYNNTNVPEIPSGLVRSTHEDQVKCSLEIGDVLFTRTSETVDDIGVASTCLCSIPRSTFAGFLIRFRPNAGTLAPRYSTYLFRNQGVQGHFSGTMNMVTRASLSQDVLKMLPVAIPPIEEQRAIANFLDTETSKIDDLVLEQRRLIGLLKEKRQAVISHAVTKGLNPAAPMKPSGIQWLGDVPEHWEIGRLNHLVGTRKGLAFKADDFCDKGVDVVKASDIKKLTIRTPSTFLPPEFVSEYPKAVLYANELVLSTVGSTPEVRNSAVGQLGRVPAELAGSLLNQNTVVFTPKKETLVNEFLYYLIQTTGYRDHLDLHAHGTANQVSLNVSDMLHIQIPLPAPIEQVEIAKYLDQNMTLMNDLSAEAERAIELLQERRTALISAAVTGKIDVREFVTPEAV